MHHLLSMAGLGLPLLQTQRTHMQAVHQKNVHHTRSVKLTVEFARRDVVQELKDQQQDKLDGLLVIDSVMIECVFSLIIEGMPSRDAPLPLLCFFALTLSMSLGMFLWSVWFVMRVQERMSRYNVLDPAHVYWCGDPHPSFHSFYLCHCYNIARYAMKALYAGVTFVIAAGSATFYSRYVVRYDVLESALGFGILLAVVCTVTMTLEVACDREPPIQSSDQADVELREHWTMKDHAWNVQRVYRKKQKKTDKNNPGNPGPSLSSSPSRGRGSINLPPHPAPHSAPQSARSSRGSINGPADQPDPPRSFFSRLVTRNSGKPERQLNSVVIA